MCSLTGGLNGALPLVERRPTTVAPEAEVRAGRPAHNPEEVASALVSGLRQKSASSPTFLSNGPRFRKSIAVMEGTQTSSPCLCSKSTV